MAQIAFVGLGKLGYPVALAYASKGHKVGGYDLDPRIKEIASTRKYPHLEPGAQKLLDEGVNVDIFDSVEDAVAFGDFVFITVQTPHKPEYEGITRMPETRADFDYTALKVAVEQVAEAALRLNKHTTAVVVSTCLPGTCDREILPLLENNRCIEFVYSPMFIAQSTVVEDALGPEFALIGVNENHASAAIRFRELLKTIHSAPHAIMSVASAELAKVAYNTALSVKITIANSLMEICHKIPNANVDDVTNSLKLATDRVISPRYLRGGMPDAGPCHPRDIIAMAWLAQKLNLSYDFFGSMVHSREAQASFIASLTSSYSVELDLSIVILGKAYKKNTNLTIGSSAILLKNILNGQGWFNIEQWDPHIDSQVEFDTPCVFVVATDHDEFYKMQFPAGSVIIDPWGKMRDMSDVRVIRVGREKIGGFIAK